MVFQKAIVPFLHEVFMPLVSTIFQALTTADDERDQVARTEKRMLQRGYFSFISTLVNNNVTEVLSNQSKLLSICLAVHSSFFCPSDRLDVSCLFGAHKL